MNKNRKRKKEQHRWIKRRKFTTKDWLKYWVYTDTAFIRLNPHE